ncbi:hypothetical protein MPH_01919 [Macrophomina phaseolina MS6]|uniref:Replication termination factor 2 n=2 Tax=Macrophomina phaseolina TaxID=35725 RepID=K2S763_MACPH|nr:hypothetical protein MPH_01919 [Macrophomina phaseolina MS6]KAH7050292.1 Rtf2 RING-finger-domain-containing protein [Macrophomina phaseolina]
MGNDGGSLLTIPPADSIPTRRELVKEAARNPTTAELKQAAQEQETHHWTTDPLSNKPLARPIVSDAHGRLYNKDSIIEHLLPAADPDDGAALQRKRDNEERVLKGAVKSLKDVVEVRFEVEEEGGAREKWICPVTREALGPGAKAVYVVPCGHAFRAEVIKEAGGEGTCLQCNEAYAPNDVIPIIPTSEEDIARLQLRVKTLKEKGLTHSLKKVGGKKKRKNVESEEKAEEKKKEKKAAAASDGIKNSATASLTARVLAEQEERNKRRKLENNDNLKSLFSAKESTGPKGKNRDFMSRGFDIPAQAKR